jgi:hypothetical protein
MGKEQERNTTNFNDTKIQRTRMAILAPPSTTATAAVLPLLYLFSQGVFLFSEYINDRLPKAPTGFERLSKVPTGSLRLR